MSAARAESKGRSAFLALWRHRYVLLHHALVAATLASLTLALHVLPAFRDVDVVTQAFVAVYQLFEEHKLRRSVADMGLELRPRFENYGDQPAILVVRAPGLQANYRCTDRDAFYVELIEALAKERPAVLVLRLPGLYPEPPQVLVYPRQEHCQRLPAGSYSDYQEPIDDVNASDPEHDAIVAAIRNAAAITPVVLSYSLPEKRITPGKNAADEQRDETFRRSLRWLKQVCTIDNVSVGFPKQSSTATYGRDTPWVGNLASSAYASRRHQTPRDRGICSVLPADAALESDPDFARLYARIEAAAAQRSQRSGFVNPRFVEAFANFMDLDMRHRNPHEAIARNMTQIDDPSSRGMRRLELAGRPLFVGTDDRFVEFPYTNARVAEVHLDAAMYYSNWVAPAERLALPFVVDLVIGTLLGVVFSWSWGMHARATRAMYSIPVARLGAKIAALLWARVVVLGFNIALFCFLLVAILWLSVKLLWQGAWLNPLPLVIGMFIKGLLSSRQSGTAHVPRTFREFATHHPDVLWQPVVIAAAMVIAVMAH